MKGKTEARVVSAKLVAVIVALLVTVTGAGVASALQCVDCHSGSSISSVGVEEYPGGDDQKDHGVFSGKANENLPALAQGAGNTYYIPGNFATIQAAIDSAVDGDEIIVRDGTYNENIRFWGKAIAVRSENGPAATIIRGVEGESYEDCGPAAVVTFWNWEGADSVLDGFTITNGINGGFGGGIACYASEPGISNCIVTDNNGGFTGGIFLCDWTGGYAAATITNCVVTNNTSGETGGVYCGGTLPMITSCTISGNSAIYAGGISCGGISVVNSVLWGNSPDQICEGSPINITYSDIQGGWTGEGNIDCDPAFACGSNYRLTSGSCCIDAGTNAGAPDKDIRGVPGPQGNGYDMGAYEFLVGVVYYVPDHFPTIQNAIDAAEDGDEIIVRDGTYNENICFWGKAITVRSESGAAVTAIDGGGSGSVVTFRSGEGADSVLDGFTITNASSTYGDGMGIYCDNSSSPTITTCIITGNTSAEGGGICCSNSSPVITNCVIAENTSDADGGGILCSGPSSPIIMNCTITDNTANVFGGGISYDSSSSPTVTNCIVWGNSPDSIRGDTGSATVTYCDVQGPDTHPGEGNINNAPLFVGSGDYHLTEESPCKDAGTSTGAPDTDIDGGSRPQGAGFDIGADEFVRRVWGKASANNNWSRPENWDPYGVPGPGDSVVFDASSNTDCVVDIPGVNIASLTLEYGYTATLTLSYDIAVTGNVCANSGTILCEGDPTAVNEASGGTADNPHGKGIVIRAQNIFVGIDAHISADYQGFANAEGPGAGGRFAGANHGGLGGVRSTGVPNSYTYGSASAPLSLGSGGGDYTSASVAGVGGGAIKLVASDTMTINGTISANGQNAPGTHAGGGAGGSIWIDAYTLCGSGAITVDGGKGRANGGGGAGGRISLGWSPGNRTFSGTIRAQGSATGDISHATHGTIYVPDGRWNEFWNENYPVNGSVALTPGTYTIDNLHITNNATLDCQGDSDGDPVEGTGVIINAIDITVDAGCAISGNRLGFPHAQGPGAGGRFAGANHGGLGGVRSTGVPNSYTYGSASAPLSLGSGGGDYTSASVAGVGGGAIKLVASDTMTINGTISANGQNAPGTHAGGGAGGSIWINADTLAGSGAVRAQGGNSDRGGGGGGRIAMYCDDDLSSLSESTSASGGSGNESGEDGTILYCGDLIPYQGDFDYDGDVDGTDLVRFAANYGQTAEALDGDFDGNGTVDDEDLAVFSSNFGKIGWKHGGCS